MAELNERTATAWRERDEAEERLTATRAAFTDQADVAEAAAAALGDVLAGYLARVNGTRPGGAR